MFHMDCDCYTASQGLLITTMLRKVYLLKKASRFVNITLKELSINGPLEVPINMNMSSKALEEVFTTP